MFGMADQCRVHMLLQHWLDIHSRIDEGKEEEKQSRAKAQLAQGKYHRKDHTIRKYSYAAYAMRFVLFIAVFLCGCLILIQTYMFLHLEKCDLCGSSETQSLAAFRWLKSLEMV